LRQLWEALESTWASIPVECFRHFVEFKPDKSRLFWGQKLNIRKSFLMFCTLSAYPEGTCKQTGFHKYSNVFPKGDATVLFSWHYGWWFIGKGEQMTHRLLLHGCSVFFSPQPSFLVLLQLRCSFVCELLTDLSKVNVVCKLFIHKPESLPQRPSVLLLKMCNSQLSSQQWQT
jgi:hypothetical protein